MPTVVRPIPPATESDGRRSVAFAYWSQLAEWQRGIIGYAQSHGFRVK
ncbi:hypothetical protein [Bifidobacterium callitrichos]|nr:hypothetical protein [Bifidobacterium callitrichos]